MKNIILLLVLLIPALLKAQNDTLYVYGPGGPMGGMEECAKAFSKRMFLPVNVVAGPEAKWIDQAKQNADLIIGGAEYLHTQFAMQLPGLVDSSTKTELYKRAAGILVRKGNSKKITSLKDLTKLGIKILDVNGAGQIGMWEDLAGKQNLIGGIQKNIAKSFLNTALAIEAWKSDNTYDAIITNTSWYLGLKDVSQLVKISVGQTLYRGTPIAITTITNKKKVVQ